MLITLRSSRLPLWASCAGESVIGTQYTIKKYRGYASKSKKRGGNPKPQEEVIEMQKWVDWQLVRFTPEDLEKYKFDMQ